MHANWGRAARRWVLFLFSMTGAFAGPACGVRGPEPESVGEVRGPIEGGYGDVADDGVVGLTAVTEFGSVFRTCSGTLLAENLVLTAQHCVAETEPFVNCSSSAFSAPFAEHRIRLTTASSMWSDIATWHTAA